MSRHDIIDAILNCFVEIEPELQPKIAAVESKLRAEWGGERVYISKTVSFADTVERRAERLGGFLRQGMRVTAAIDAAGLDRRTGFRLLRRRSR